MNLMEIEMKPVTTTDRLTKTLSLSAFTLSLGLVMAAAAPASAVSNTGPVAGPDTLQVAGMAGVKPDALPKVIKAVSPEYPSHAQAIGREGWVIVELDIDEQGKPYNAEIVDNGPSPLFKRSTLRAIEQFRFEPATYAGEPVAVTGKRYKVVYAFQDS